MMKSWIMFDAVTVFVLSFELASKSQANIMKGYSCLQFVQRSITSAHVTANPRGADHNQSVQDLTYIIVQFFYCPQQKQNSEQVC